jgi:citrate lyase subunit beta / citryl-CoA lyase
MTKNPRSCLCVPGSSARMMDKALGSSADEVVLDLEDSVAPSAKADARSLVVRAISDLPTERRVAIRVNGVGTAWCHDDLIAVGSARRRPDSVILPKVESTGDLAFVDRLLDGLDAGQPGPTVLVQALIESAAGLQDVAAIAGSSPRLEALILGYADLAASLGRSPASGAWDPAREQLLWAARAAGIRAVDGPHLGTAPDEAFERSVTAASAAGFDAKWMIHPSQIDAVNQAFSPTADQVIWARRVVEALSEADAAGRGAVALDGAMLDEAVAVNARRVLARAEAER